MPWVLVSPDFSKTVNHKMYFVALAFDEDGSVIGAGVTPCLEDAARFDSKHEALESEALGQSTFVAEEVEE